jgi:hypothetical protein
MVIQLFHLVLRTCSTIKPVQRLKWSNTTLDLLAPGQQLVGMANFVLSSLIKKKSEENTRPTAKKLICDSQQSLLNSENNSANSIDDYALTDK